MKKLQEADVDGRGGLKLSSVVAEYTGPLERFFRRRVADPAEVDDLVQEVFLRLARQSVAALKAALAELPERTQTVFVLHRFEGLRYGEIAVTLGISVSAVEKHMMRAMSHIVRGMEWP